MRNNTNFKGLLKTYKREIQELFVFYPEQNKMILDKSCTTWEGFLVGGN